MADGKSVFTSVSCLYVKGKVWQKSVALSRITIYSIPSDNPPFRLVITSVGDNSILVNSPVTPQLNPKRSRDDFITFLIKYPSGHSVSYGIQMKGRKNADNLLNTIMNADNHKPKSSKKSKGGELVIGGPVEGSFQHRSHGPSPGGAPTAMRRESAPGGALPSEWMEAKAPDGRTYYYNQNGETTWQRPSAAPPTPRSSSVGGVPGIPGATGAAMTGAGASSAQSSQPANPEHSRLAQELLGRLPQNLRRVPTTEIKVAAAIGKGCYGTVYEGQWSGRPVAVKSLDASARTDFAKSIDEFETEVVLMTKIPPHQHVLGILGVLTTLPNLSIILEFMELTDLYAVLTSGDPISASMEDMWVSGIANGLRHIARTGIIHRDIAARNVLLNRDYQPKIADFGLAVTVADNGVMEETALNKWLAPEAIRDRIYSLKSDVWSYGVTVWEIVEKSIPYPGLDPMMAAMRIVGEGLTPEISNNASPQHQAVMKACFVLEQEKRASMEDICNILQIP